MGTIHRPARPLRAALSLEIVMCETLYVRAISTSVSSPRSLTDRVEDIDMRTGYPE